MMINNFSITKNKYKVQGDKKPDYKLSAKIDDKFVDIGSAWTKESSTGSGAKYLSVKLAEGLNITGEIIPYQKKTQQNQSNQDF